MYVDETLDEDLPEDSLVYQIAEISTYLSIFVRIPLVIVLWKDSLEFRRIVRERIEVES